MVRSAAILSLLLLALPASAQEVCRPGTLGTANCSVTGFRPLPRPPWDTLRSLEKLQAQQPDTAPDIIPAREVNSLGKVLIDPPGGIGNGFCRTNTLGSLRCR